MPRITKVLKADDNKHKWIAHFEDGTTTKFGAYGYDDYTILRARGADDAESRRKKYLARHQKDLRTKDPQRAGYLSYYLLWNKSTIEESIRDYNRMFASS